jgi:hypothetical protein
MDNFEDMTPGRERQCLRDDPILENATLTTPCSVNLDGTEATTSTGQPPDEVCAESLSLGRALSASEMAEARRRAHTRLAWWLPEILSQVGGMLCLMGRFNRVYSIAKLSHPDFV